MAGAREVAATLKAADVVIVIDVTGVKTDKDIVFEKVKNRALRKFIAKTMKSQAPEITYDIYADCVDEIASQDETDVYRKYTDFVFFLGVPVRGGDYNDGPVYCWKRSIDATARAMIVLTKALVGNFDTLRNLPKASSSSEVSGEPTEPLADLFG